MFLFLLLIWLLLYFGLGLLLKLGCTLILTLKHVKAPKRLYQPKYNYKTL